MNNTPHWIPSAFIYHLYPLGQTAAPQENQFDQSPEERIAQLYPWLDHLQWLGINTLFLGPILQSSSHGYDLADYFQIDRRLGTNQSFKTFANEVHRRGMRLILDAVFNHSGRDFFAFRDLQQNGRQSQYLDWYEAVRFDHPNPMGDPFDYQTWAGHYTLPKFNLANPAVRAYLFQAVRFWFEEWGIDGLRLDTADHVRFDFWQELRRVTSSMRPDFWLMGEVVHGQYQQWADPQHLHSVTNYEAYKGLYSSLNDANYFEIAHSLQRQFAEDGIYRDLMLYNFVDNHDVNRVASQLKNQQHLYPLYALLFSMPGIPSIYYGSEWDISGQRNTYSDQALRPAIDLHHLIRNAPEAKLPASIQKLAQFRADTPALQTGSYRQAQVSAQQFAFWRETDKQKVLVVLNSASDVFTLSGILIPEHLQLQRVFENQSDFRFDHDQLEVNIPPNWVSIFVFE
ncbi:MAG: alpha-amylase [Chloroflexi bacterium HGW-Chloroflexi-3]|nr:MAG: alpha-amylase [Chloroflexi bacterium HGW-Chloroflexi-3]